ncbi:hypothetical protein E4U60_005453 [Claviceps pazoutovae]|uniref:Uncharacterized protein n=1 Tax=Claviceps pazoutovae TaxID=1649127 RepID=A0A9P7M7N5_9HYPO|nr:hypothetical protein E4U60_005453 [Claviceps pazoutovae]
MFIIRAPHVQISFDEHAEVRIEWFKAQCTQKASQGVIPGSRRLLEAIWIQRAYKATPERWVRIPFSQLQCPVPYLKITLIIVYSVYFDIVESCQRRMMHVAVIMKRRHAATRNQLGPESAPLVYR